jgi:hypothetical protein
MFNYTLFFIFLCWFSKPAVAEIIDIRNYITAEVPLFSFVDDDSLAPLGDDSSRSNDGGLPWAWPEPGNKLTQIKLQIDFEMIYEITVLDVLGTSSNFPLLDASYVQPGFIGVSSGVYQEDKNCLENDDPVEKNFRNKKFVVNEILPLSAVFSPYKTRYLNITFDLSSEQVETFGDAASNLRFWIQEIYVEGKLLVESAEVCKDSPPSHSPSNYPLPYPTRSPTGTWHPTLSPTGTGVPTSTPTKQPTDTYSSGAQLSCSWNFDTISDMTFNDLLEEGRLKSVPMAFQDMDAELEVENCADLPGENYTSCQGHYLLRTSTRLTFYYETAILQLDI